MDKLEIARQEINEIDCEMARLFVRRMEAAKLVAEYKQEHGMPVFDATREAEVIRRGAERVSDDELRSYYINFITNNMELSKAYQHRLLDGMTVAYCGVPGAFAQIAAMRIFPDGNTKPYGSFREAYDAVVDGECDCAVLPIENSFQGDVTQVMDLAFFGPLYISGTYDLQIVHNLLANEGATPESIKKVLSHPQALGQCAGYIESKGYEPRERSNTAIAAKEVRESGRTDVAAIASAYTAELYGLKVLDKNINQSYTNTTRFAVFTRSQKRIEPTDNQFIMFFTVKNEAGSLGRVVSIIGEHGFNLKALKSRPTKELIWEYYFFVESSGNIESEAGRRMLARLAAECSAVKVVGSFERDVMLKE